MARAKRNLRVVSDEERSRAWRAVKEFRKLSVGLNAYARAVTGNRDVKVIATDGTTATDGVRIFVRPPIELGDATPHDKSLCDRRGDNKRQLCKACDVREMALASVFHEIAHIVFGSHVEPEPDGIDAIRKLINEWHPREACNHASEIIMTWRDEFKYLDYADSFSQVLTLMVNSLEDSRVNAAQFRARPGTRTIMEANLREIFESGVGELNLGPVAQVHTESVRWQDRSFPWQLMIGLFLEASEYYDVTDTLDHRVGKILREPSMAEALARIANADDAHMLVIATCDVFRELVKVGALEMPKCEPPPPPVPTPPIPGDGEQEEQDEQEEQPDQKDEGGEFGQSKQGTAKPPEKDDKDDGGQADTSGDDSQEDGGNSPDASGGRGDDDRKDGDKEEHRDDRGTGSDSPDDDKGDGDQDIEGGTEAAGRPDDDSESERVPEGTGSASDETDADGGSDESGDSGELPEGSTEPDDEPASEGAEHDGTDDGTDRAADEAGQGDRQDDPAEADGADGEGRGEVDDGSERPDGGTAPGEDSQADGDEAGGEDLPDSDSRDDLDGGAATGTSQSEATGDSVDPGRAGTDQSEDVQGAGDSSSGSEASTGDLEDGSRDEHRQGPEEADGLGTAGDAGHPDEQQEAVAQDGGEAGASNEPLQVGDENYQPTEQDGETEYESAPVPNAPGLEGEDDEVDDPITAISVDELLDAMRAATLHKIFGKRDDFATGSDEVCGGGHHDPDSDPGGLPDELVQAIATAVLQAGFFDTASREVSRVDIIEYGNQRHRWSQSFLPDMFKPAEPAIGKSVHEARVLFDANARGRKLANLKAGKVDGRNLAKRIPQQDPRMFQKKVLPKKISYEVFITGDISGSTASHDRISRIKRAMYGQAEMLHRVGVPFELWAHSAGWSDVEDMRMMDMWMFHIKGSNEPWSPAIKQRLADLRPQAGNLDGHTLEFVRKRAERSTATNKIICYYTDGAMPASNYDEELEILQREIKYCKQQGIALLAVGIDTDSPEEHGFRTCQVNGDADLPNVIKMLKEQMV